MRLARRCAACAALALLPALPQAAHAKGVFQAEGLIRDIEKGSDAIVFRFVGKLSFGYASAPDTHPRRRWRDIAWEFVDVPVQVSHWTRRNKPGERSDEAEAERAYESLARLAAAGRPVRFSLDNPGLSFSNRGQLVGVSGTQIYPAEAAPPARRRK
jgi:hypothetical protein